MIEQITSAIQQNLGISTSKIADYLKQKKILEWNGFTGSSANFLLSDLLKNENTLLYIAKDFEKAASVASDFEEMGVSNIYLFPPTRNKPYDEEKVVDMSIMVQRSEVLEMLHEKPSLTIIASVDAITEKLVPASQFYESSIHLKKGDEYPPNELSEKLADQGYRATRFVDAPGEYAIRGGIFDVFPFSGEYPVRLEFFGDEIDSIREFDPDSQRSIAFLNDTRLVPNAASSENGEKDSLMSYLPEDAFIAAEDTDLIREEIQQHFEKATEVYQSIDQETHPQPASEYLTTEEWDDAVQAFGLILLGSFNKNW